MIYLFRKICDIIMIFILSGLIVFDVTLLVSVFKNRKDGVIPFAYITLMTVAGIPEKSVIIEIACGTFLSAENYELYRYYFGKQNTLTITCSYLFLIIISFLMTMNRLIIVARPASAYMFTTANILKIGGILYIIDFISLIIPYYSECYINLDAITNSFKSNCAPDRHPITLFQNKYTILVPFIAMILNIGIVLHLKCVRMGIYKKLEQLWDKHRRNMPVVSTNSGHTELTRLQRKREAIMMKQSITTAIYLAIYEFVSFLIRTFPNVYAVFPDELKLVIIYSIFSAAGAINFFVYYTQMPSIRKIIRSFTGLDRHDTTITSVFDRRSRSSHTNQ